jgi:hypothetical protein
MEMLSAHRPVMGRFQPPLPRRAMLCSVKVSSPTWLRPGYMPRRPTLDVTRSPTIFGKAAVRHNGHHGTERLGVRGLQSEDISGVNMGWASLVLAVAETSCMVTRTPRRHPVTCKAVVQHATISWLCDDRDWSDTGSSAYLSWPPSNRYQLPHILAPCPLAVPSPSQARYCGFKPLTGLCMAVAESPPRG